MRSLTAAFLTCLATLSAVGATHAEDYGCECLAHRLEAFQPARRTDRPGRWVEPGKGKFDPATGADFRHWPPDRLVDYRKIRVELKVADLAVRKAEGVATLTVRPIASPVESLSLNAEQLKVSKVTVGDGPSSTRATDMCWGCASSRRCRSAPTATFAWSTRSRTRRWV